MRLAAGNDEKDINLIKMTSKAVKTISYKQWIQKDLSLRVNKSQKLSKLFMLMSKLKICSLNGHNLLKFFVGLSITTFGEIVLIGRLVTFCKKYGPQEPESVLFHRTQDSQ